eukprot:s1076_g4.t1
MVSLRRGDKPVLVMAYIDSEIAENRDARKNLRNLHGRNQWMLVEALILAEKSHAEIRLRSLKAPESSSEEKSSSLWSQLPSFDPAVDDVREFMQKARFLHGVFPEKDKGSLAPRLAMLCKGTAWSQVRLLDPSKLIVPETGVEYLLEALSSWEETSELKTFELFEKALYKITQKPDEAANSYTLRLQAAFNDLGDKVTIKEMQAFILLRQSCLSVEDKKRVLAMSDGKLSLKAVEQAMRTLSTRVLLGAAEPKKKIYPTNFTESEQGYTGNDDEISVQSTYQAAVEEEDVLTTEAIDLMAQSGDEDAMMVQQFEKDFEDMVQDIPDFQSALISYQEARARISDRRRSRGFWPPSKGKSKGYGKDQHGGFRGGRKGGPKGKEELLSRISRTHCKICGALGHWKAECPQRKDQPREQANVVQPDGDDLELPQVIVEELDEALKEQSMLSVCFNDVLEALRSLSEEVLASLRLLFCMIFSMTTAVMPGELVTEQEMGPIQQLINEVKVQREKIMELGDIISNQFKRSTGPSSPSPATPIMTPGGDVWELAEEEELMVEMPPQVGQQRLIPAQVPSTSLPISSNRMTPEQTAPLPQRVIRIAGMPANGRPSDAQASNSAPANADPDNNQVMLTQTALDTWGNKVATWGKKHKGTRYVDIYQQDQGYVKWVLARVGSLHEDIEDFAQYATTRRKLESMAIQNVGR